MIGFDYSFEQYHLWFIVSLGRGICCYPSSDAAQKGEAVRPEPPENAHPDVLGLLQCPCSLCGVTPQGHQLKRAIKIAADWTLQILALDPSFRQLIPENQ